MANLLLFPPQEFKLTELDNQFPRKGFRNRKYIFQCEVRQILNSKDVIFGVIGYPAWRNGNAPRETWIIGKLVRGKTIRPADPADPDETVWFDPADEETFIALGNNEVFLGPSSRSKAKNRTKIILESEKNFIVLYKSIIKDKKRIEKASFVCKSYISKNPHVYYSVTLSDGSTSETYLTNPCPPNRPAE